MMFQIFTKDDDFFQNLKNDINFDLTLKIIMYISDGSGPKKTGPGRAHDHGLRAGPGRA